MHMLVDLSVSLQRMVVAQADNPAFLFRLLPADLDFLQHLPDHLTVCADLQQFLIPFHRLQMQLRINGQLSEQLSHWLQAREQIQLL